MGVTCEGKEESSEMREQQAQMYQGTNEDGVFQKWQAGQNGRRVEYVKVSSATELGHMKGLQNNFGPNLTQ